MSFRDNIYRKRYLHEEEYDPELRGLQHLEASTNCLNDFSSRNVFLHPLIYTKFSEIKRDSVMYGRIQLGLTGEALCEYVKREVRRYFSQFNIYIY